MLAAKGLEKFLRHDVDILASYLSFPKSGGITRPPYCQDLFIDSGAFGKNSHTVSIQSYVNFLKANMDRIDIYANLDVIGNPEKSYLNLTRIEKFGLSPLPVFHYGSQFKWLDRLLDGKYDYIALGGLVPISGNYKAMRNFLDVVWMHILRKNKAMRVHGFGIQNIDIMKRYPWYSVDASSIHMQARYGGVLTPFGFIKINPKVNSRESRWQHARPLELDQIKKFVGTYLDFPFELAQQQSVEGMLARAATSIHWLVSEFKDHKWQKLISVSPKMF